MEIDFREIADRNSVRNISGHEHGVAARELFKLDALDKSNEPVEVLVPENIEAIASSFFQGMFAKSVQTLGKDNFLSHYRFVASPLIMKQVLRGIDRSLTRRNRAVFEHQKDLTCL